MEKHFPKGNLATNDITVGFYVRRILDEGRVQQFMELYKNGVKLPPPVVFRKSKQLVAGRHRLEARKRLGLESTECELAPDTDNMLKMVDMAINGDIASSLPLTQEDIIFTMRNLIEGGESGTKVRTLFLQHLPAPVVRRYLKDAYANVKKSKIAAALREIADGELSAKQAAEQYGIELKELRDAIRSRKNSSEERDEKVTNAVQRLSLHTRPYSNRCRNVIVATLQAFEDGEISEKDARGVVKHFEKIASRIQHNAADFVRRFEALVTTRKQK